MILFQPCPAAEGLLMRLCRLADCRAGRGTTLRQTPAATAGKASKFVFLFNQLF